MAEKPEQNIPPEKKEHTEVEKREALEEYYRERKKHAGTIADPGERTREFLDIAARETNSGLDARESILAAESAAGHIPDEQIRDKEAWLGSVASRAAIAGFFGEAKRIADGIKVRKGVAMPERGVAFGKIAQEEALQLGIADYDALDKIVNDPATKADAQTKTAKALFERGEKSEDIRRLLVEAKSNARTISRNAGRSVAFIGVAEVEIEAGLDPRESMQNAEAAALKINTDFREDLLNSAIPYLKRQFEERAAQSQEEMKKG